MLQVIIFKGYTQCSNRLTNDIDLSTGYDHEAAQFYPLGAQDQYWKITSAPPSYVVPVCASCGGEWNHIIWGGLSSSEIGFNPPTFNAAGNTSCSDNCHPNDPVYRFERQFCVNTDKFITTSNPDGLVSATMNFSFCGDKNVKQIQLVGPGGIIVFQDQTCYEQISCPHTMIFSFDAQTGIYKLVIDVLNDWECTGFFPVQHYNTPMRMELKGRVFSSLSSNKIFADNNHYGKDPSCSPPYSPGPEFALQGDSCLDAPATSSTFYISPYLNYAGGNTYTITGPSSPAINDLGFSVGTFTVEVGTYTITSTDAKGCVFSSELNIREAPTLTVSPTNSCIPTGTSIPISLYPGTGVRSDYTWSIDGDLPFSSTTPFFNLSQGIHTITIIAPGGCTADATTVIGYELGMFMSPEISQCLPVGGSVNITSAITPYNTGGHKYSTDGGITWVPSNIASIDAYTYTVSATGVYTVYGKDAYGCTSSGTTTVLQTPTPVITLAKSATCVSASLPATLTATATGTGGPFQYVLNGGTPQNSNLFNITAPGSYTVTVIGANGCPSPSTANAWFANCDHCTYNTYPATMFPTPPPITSATWYVNELASSLPASAFPAGPIVIDGSFTIDATFNIIGRPDIYFTENAYINQASTANLNIVNSTLQGCGLWQGIRVSPLLIDGSVVKNMKGYGIYMQTGGTYNVKNSIFEENNTSISIIHYGGANSLINTTIEGNTFRKINTLVADPLNKVGIEVHGGASVTIGNLSDVNKGNTFRKLLYGIRIGDPSYASTPSSIVNLYNNSFYDIKSLASTSPSAPALGAAILCGCDYSGYLISNQKILNVKTINNDPAPIIDNCDRGIVNSNYDLNAEDLYIQNTLYGIIDIYARHTLIKNNHISNAQIGIKYLSPYPSYPVWYTTNPYNAHIENNVISTRNSGIITSASSAPVHRATPIGINIIQHHPDNNPIDNNTYYFVNNNEIYLNAVSGIGINPINIDKHYLIMDNYVKINSGDPGSSFQYNIRDYFGYWLSNNIQTSFWGNTTMGYIDHSLMQSVRSSTGFLMNQSPQCLLICNKTKYTRFGFYVWGNNLSTTSKFGNAYSHNIYDNKFSANYLPWCFVDAGSAYPASFGWVGDLSHDNMNNLLGAVNWLNSGNFKVVRFSSVPLQHKIFTSTSRLLQSQSISIPSGNEYLVVNNNMPDVDYCPDPLFKLATLDDNTETEFDSTELNRMVDIANGDGEYIDYNDVGKWMNEYNLYEVLRNDSTLRQSSPAFISFYNEQLGSMYERIYNAQEKISKMEGETESEQTLHYNDALAANNLIEDGLDWEMNEKYINDVQIKLKYDGLDSLTEADKLFVLSIAEQCPFVAGSSVYKARAILGLWDNESQFDDRILCLSSSNKNFNNSISNPDSLYSNLVESLSQSNNPPMTTIGDNNYVVVYPNPANTLVTIQYSCKEEGAFELMNNLGQTVLTTILPKLKKQTELQLNGLSEGVYYYRCRFQECHDFYGKLTIQK